METTYARDDIVSQYENIYSHKKVVVNVTLWSTGPAPVQIKNLIFYYFDYATLCRTPSYIKKS